MFTTIGNFLSPNKTRETEKTDTHQYIRQHQRDQNRKKGDENKKEDLFSTDDQASVTTDALYAFLENFLNEQINSKKEPEIRSFLDNMKSLTQAKRKTFDKPVNPAIHAYQHAAETSPDKHEKQHKEHKNIDDSELLDNQDMKSMYALMKDVEILLQNGIEEIKMVRGETFLDSLILSVAAEKNQIANV